MVAKEQVKKWIQLLMSIGITASDVMFSKFVAIEIQLFKNGFNY